jgi:hypothetical protein
MSYCKSCGGPIDPNVKFCAKCGADTTAQAPAAATPAAPQVPPQPKAQSSASFLSKKQVHGVVSAVAVLLVMLVFAGWFSMTVVTDWRSDDTLTSRTHPISTSRSLREVVRIQEDNARDLVQRNEIRERYQPVITFNAVSHVVMVVSILSTLALAAFMFLKNQGHNMASLIGLAGFGLAALASVIFIFYMLIGGSDLRFVLESQLGIDDAGASIWTYLSLLASLAGGALVFLFKKEFES